MQDGCPGGIAAVRRPAAVTCRCRCAPNPPAVRKLRTGIRSRKIFFQDFRRAVRYVLLQRFEFSGAQKSANFCGADIFAVKPAALDTAEFYSVLRQFSRHLPVILSGHRIERFRACKADGDSENRGYDVAKYFQICCRIDADFRVLFLLKIFRAKKVSSMYLRSFTTPG